jgi:hypothetical protein
MANKLMIAMVAAVFMGPGVVYAQGLPTAGAARGAQDDDVVYQSETTYDFDGDDVEGNLVRPDGESITGERRGKTSSLINIRSDFIPEMLKSVETL